MLESVFWNSEKLYMEVYDHSVFRRTSQMSTVKLKLLASMITLTLIVIPLAIIGFANAKHSSEVRLSRVLETTSLKPVEIMEPADSVQAISLSLGEFDYAIVVSSYSSTHTNSRFTYTLTFTVTGGSLEFIICTQPEANQWAQGYPIYVSTSDHWSSTSGVTTTRSFLSNVALAFIFNHEASGSRSVSGSISIDTSPPSIMCSLISNATYNGTVLITANATDTMSGVESMELLIDDTSKKTTSSGSIEYNWGTTAYSNGNHTITIHAEDGVGRVGEVVYEVWVENTGFLFPNIDSMSLVLGGGLLGVFIIYYLIKRAKTRG
jgi:hypothetical protein